MSGRKPARERGARYPIEYVASEIGIDRMLLVRECGKAEIDTSNGLNFREAYAALSGKIEAEKSRRRRQDAEVEDKELDVQHKRGLFGYLTEFSIIIRDYATKIRVYVESCTWLSKADRQRLIVGLREIKAELPKASNAK